MQRGRHLRVRLRIRAFRLLARAAQLDASHHFRRSSGLHYRVCVRRAFPAFFLFFETLSYGKQVRQALIRRRMAWIERERKRRFVGVFFA